MRLFLFVFFLNLFAQSSIAQNANTLDTTIVANIQPEYINVDSLRAIEQIRVTDSIMRSTWVLPASILNNHAFLDSVQKEYLFPTLDLYAWNKKYNHLKKKENPYKEGKLLEKGNVSLLGFVFLMLVVFAVLRNVFYKQLTTIVQSFFSNRILINVNKEDNLFSSWPFLLLFIQFGFIFGLFFFLVAQYYKMYQVQQGFKFFLIISVIIIALYAFKLICLRFLAVLFDLQKPINEYISILYLSYFNASLLFIPLVVAFALSPLKYGPIYIGIAVLILVVIFVIQLLRAGINILSNNKFSKMHLILYFCALEVCPILVLIKALGLL